MNIDDEKLKKCLTIYDVMAELYLYLNTNMVHDFKKQYGEFLKSRDFKLIYNSINSEIQILKCVGKDEFKYWIALWINVKNKNKKNELMYCYQTLKELDNNYELFSKNNGWKGFQGPLNISSNKLIFLYNMNINYYQKSYFEKNKIRDGRQTIPYSASKNLIFKNFLFVERNCLSGFIPKIKRYESNFQNNDVIKIAFAPIDRSEWFNLSIDKIANEISINYDYNKYDLFLEKFKNLIHLAEHQKADIIIFPELSLFPNQKNIICNYLKQCNFSYLKIIFAGSCWNNNYNKSYIISSKGSVLCSNTKKEIYNEYNKNFEIMVNEAINYDNNIELLDIKGLGRISYLICKDFIANEITSICNILKTNFIFVSSYTHDMKSFKNQSDSVCKTTGNIVSICNSCSVAGNNGLITCCSVPIVNIPKQLSSNFKSDTRDTICCDNCESCLKIYEIKF